MLERSISEYARALRPSLPVEMFAPVWWRALWLPAHAAIIAVALVGIARHWGGWPATIGFSLVIGHSFAGAAFVAHETLHGSVVRARTLRLVIGGLAFLPFSISPTLWIAWHNRVHHGHTAESGTDPDTYPTFERYRESRAIRIVDHISIGRRRLAGLLTLFFGFTGQSLLALSQGHAALGLSVRRQHAAVGYTAASLLGWIALGLWIGPWRLVFAFVLPLMIGNAIVMSYILTNHSLSPLTHKNDPLLNSLSVTTPRFLERLHLGFGFHVEHHLFPALSPRYAPVVRRLVRERWPERYQSMPLWRAWRRLWITPRIYEDAITLVDPRHGARCRTLLPRAAPFRLTKETLRPTTAGWARLQHPLDSAASRSSRRRCNTTASGSAKQSRRG